MKNLIFTFILFVLSYLVSGQIYNITLSVDVSQFSGVVSMVKVNGGFSGWATAYELSNTSGSIWEVTVPMNVGTTDYRFEIIDNGDVWYPEWPDNNATGDCFNGTNMRLITVTGDAALETVCWQSCNSCVSTFQKSFEANQINIFVNSANALIITGLKEGVSEVSIYDINGKLSMVKTIQVVGQESILELTQNLCKGIHIIKIDTAKIQIVKKIIIN